MILIFLKDPQLRQKKTSDEAFRKEFEKDTTIRPGQGLPRGCQTP